MPNPTTFTPPLWSDPRSPQGWDAMKNFDLNSIDANRGLLRPNGWPTRSKYQGQWCHSDLKDVAYFYVFKFYAKAIEKGDLR